VKLQILVINERCIFLQEMKDAFFTGIERHICCREWKTHLLQEMKDASATGNEGCICCRKWKTHLLQEIKDPFAAGNERPICCRKSKTHLLQEIKDAFTAENEKCICCGKSKHIHLQPYTPDAEREKHLVRTFQQSSSSDRVVEIIIGQRKCWWIPSSLS
jgi:hypothetical protein